MDDCAALGASFWGGAHIVAAAGALAVQFSYESLQIGILPPESSDHPQNTQDRGGH
jgi:hypothetical protein